MPNTVWFSTFEQNLFDLLLKCKAGLENPLPIATFGLKQAAVYEASGKVNASLTTRAVYTDKHSSQNRLEKDEAKEAAKQAMQILPSYKPLPLARNLLTSWLLSGFKGEAGLVWNVCSINIITAEEAAVLRTRQGEEL